jgi:hypothetical protein
MHKRGAKSKGRFSEAIWDSREVGLEAFPPEDQPPVDHTLFHIPPHGRHGPSDANRPPM